MPETPQKIDWKEATNNNLNEAEQKAINTLVNAVKSNLNVKDAKDVKDQIQQTNEFASKIDAIVHDHFDVDKSKSNVENRNTKEFLYESLLGQMWVAYNSEGNASGANDQTLLDSAYHIMMLFKPDSYGKNSSNYKRYIEGSTNDLDSGLERKDLLHPFVEQELQNIYNKPSDLYRRKTKKTQTVTAEEYNKNKDMYTNQGWKYPSTREIPGGPDKKEIISAAPIHMDRQYFFRGQADISNGIKSQVPDIQAKIKELKSKPNIVPDSIKITINSSVSNISYPDNKGLLQNRSAYVASLLSDSFDKKSIQISNPEYTGTGTERGPGYPPSLADIQKTFTDGSEALKSLQSVPGFISLDQVVSSMETQKAESPFFDTLEQYLYRPFQYADISISYQTEETIPTTTQVVDLEKKNVRPDVEDNSRFLKSVMIIAENPYYEQMKTSPLAKAWDAVVNATSSKPIDTKNRPTIKIDGISYPYTKYIQLNMSDNKLTQPTEWIGLQSVSKDFQKHVANNKSLEERQKGKYNAISDKMYLQLKTAEDVSSFSKNIIKSDEDQGRTITNKQQAKFVIDYIKQQK